MNISDSMLVLVFSLGCLTAGLSAFIVSFCRRPIGWIRWMLAGLIFLAYMKIVSGIEANQPPSRESLMAIAAFSYVVGLIAMSCISPFFRRRSL